MQTDTPSAPPSERAAAPPDINDPRTWPLGCTPREPADWSGLPWGDVIYLLRNNEITLELTADGDVLPFAKQEDFGRWEEHLLVNQHLAHHEQLKFDPRYRAMSREFDAAVRLHGDPWHDVTDVDMARAATLPPLTARRTTSRARGAGRPAGRPSARRTSRSGSGDDDGSGSSGEDDPHPAPLPRLSPQAIADAQRILDRAARRLLAEARS